ncbi:hypothetical protein J121_2870 [Qipengyuania citrea LAMA 915]|uniref:Uncharacterized protein n=1 Tax=Qipengyuania citrea LAMA 915 TaxID=1306953 RepID=A0A0L1KGU0_9SPHN|nr:hypothetical protein [Qipengyuania citrea]KNH03091.1 hypothetical protein J121_2870 [Qipengyuania citrea LAMA 915]
MREGGNAPGPVSGFGGGTFNIDGSQVTPAENGDAPMRSAPPLGAGARQGPLGGSMRQPFDYDAAKKALVGDAPQVKDWQKVLAVVADGIASYQGRTPTAVQGIVERQSDFEDRRRYAAEQLAKWQYQDHARQSEADLRAANPFTIGRERLAYDPATGETSVQYRGRQDAEIYADTLGFDRGSEEWGAAVEDYVLRSSGPSAHMRDMEIDDHRTGNDRMLEGFRQRNRMEMEGARQSNRRGMVDYRNANPAPSRGGSRRAARPTATDASGNKVEWDGKAWVPVK